MTYRKRKITGEAVAARRRSEKYQWIGVSKNIDVAAKSSVSAKKMA
jgi:hypothetical protein